MTDLSGHHHCTLDVQVEVPHYDPSTLACERLEATSHDGCKVPISIVYR